MKGSQQRYIEDFLRHDFGVRQVRIENRSKHAKLCWEHDGKTYSYMVSRTPSETNYHTLKNAKSDIRRMMRGPVFNPVLIVEEATVDNLMEDVRERAVEEIAAQPPAPELALEPAPESEQKVTAPAPAPAKTWSVTISAYRYKGSGVQAQILFPRDILLTLPTFRVEQLDAEHWKFRRGGPRAWTKVPWAKDRQVRTSVAATHPIEPFAAMRADAVEVDGEVLLYVPLAERKPLSSTMGRPTVAPKKVEEAKPEPGRWAREFQKQVEAAKPEPAPPPVTPTPAPARPPAIAALEAASLHLEAHLREVLGRVRDIEHLTPYRLWREGDALMWRAPVIE